MEITQRYSQVTENYGNSLGVPPSNAVWFLASYTTECGFDAGEYASTVEKIIVVSTALLFLEVTTARVPLLNLTFHL